MGRTRGRGCVRSWSSLREPAAQISWSQPSYKVERWLGLAHLLRKSSAFVTFMPSIPASPAGSLIAWKIAVGSMVPDLVPPISPSSGVKPIPVC